MKLPLKPPPFEELFTELIQNGRYLELSRRFSGNVPKKYLHWDQLRFRQVPDGMSLRDWWCLIKSARISASKNITLLLDKENNPFSYNITESIYEALHEIDMNSGGLIQTGDKNIDIDPQCLFSNK